MVFSDEREEEKGASKKEDESGERIDFKKRDRRFGGTSEPLYFLPDRCVGQKARAWYLLCRRTFAALGTM